MGRVLLKEPSDFRIGSLKCRRERTLLGQQPWISLATERQRLVKNSSARSNAATDSTIVCTVARSNS